VLARYAAERFLYRLSRSRYADRFVLKGALMMLVWLGETIRPTRLPDLCGRRGILVDHQPPDFGWSNSCYLPLKL
jgi:hypothetical protein